MADGWNSPAVVTSAIGVFISAGAAVVTWLNYRMLAAQKEIVVRADFDRRQTFQPALAMRLNIENFSASVWNELRLEVRKPRSVRIACLESARIKGHIRPYDYETFADAFDGEKSAKPIVLPGTLQASGAVQGDLFGRSGIPADSLWKDILFDWDDIRPGQSLSMRLTLLSSDAKRRKQVVQIKRTVPDRITEPAS